MLAGDSGLSVGLVIETRSLLPCSFTFHFGNPSPQFLRSLAPY